MDNAPVEEVETEEPKFVPADHNQSIHPRVRGGKRVYDKVNTCMQPKKPNIQRRVDAIEAHLDNHPRDVLSQKHLSKLKEKL